MSLEDVPAVFADAVGINLLSAQVILSITVIFALLLPTMILAKGKNAMTIYLLVFVLTECLLVGLGWLNFWILIMTVVVIALGVAKSGTDLVVGGG